MMLKKKLFLRFFGFRCFLTLFKFGAGLHYALQSSLGEKIFPLWIVGLCMSIASLGQMVLDIPAGNMLDRYGYKNMLIIGTSIFIGSVLIFLLGFNQYTFLISIFGSIFGRLFFGPGINAYALSHAPRGSSGTFMAYRDMGASLGIVLSCLALPFVIHLSSFYIGIIMGSILIIAAIAIICSPNDIKKITITENVHEKTHHQKRLALKSLLIGIKQLNPASSLLMLHNFCGAILYGIIWFVVPLIIQHNPEKGTILGIGLSMFDFSILVVGGVLSLFVDKSDKRLIIFIGLILFSLSGFMLGFNFGIIFLILAFLTTTGDEMASLPLWTWMHQLDTEHNKDGLISGLINLFEDLGWAIGPLVAGILYEFLGAQYTIMIGAIPLVLLTVLYYIVIKRHFINIPFLYDIKKPHKTRSKS